MTSLSINDRYLQSGASSSAEASTSYQTQLPDKKTFIATLSGGAFVVGLTCATIYGLRKARLQALKEAQELAQASIASTQQASSSSLASSRASAVVPSVLRARSAARASAATANRWSPAASEAVEGDAHGSRSAFALFKQMNTDIFSPSKRAPPVSSDSSSRAPTSVFDDETGTLPSVLRRRKAGPAVSSSASSSHQSAPAPILASSSRSSSNDAGSSIATLPNPNESKIDYSEMDSTLDFLGLSTPVPLDEQQRLKALEEEASAEHGPSSFFQSPVGLSLKAFFIATSIVAMSTLATVEAAKWALDVKTMDEFVVAMTKVIPSRRSGEASLEGAAPHMRVRDREDYIPGCSAREGVAAPKSVDQALTDLSKASSFEEWVSTLKSQLDTERDYEVQRRFAGVSAWNDSISPTSSRSYAINSPLELGDLERNRAQSMSFFRSVLAISPVLPTTAFGLGLVSGVLTAGKRAGLVFMAENAHRLPDTVQGWYFYSKTKNYKVMLGAAKGGLKQGVRLGIWTTGFCLAEQFAKVTRASVQKQFSGGREGWKVLGHWTDGVLAGVVTAGAVTALYRLPKASAMRVFQLGLLAGASTGGIRDLQERLVDREIGGVASHT